MPARGQGGLKTIDNPGGGQLVYGPLDDQNSLPAAMGFMLRMVHGHFGDRPQISRFFHAGSNSVATFFTLTAKTQGGKHLSGMVIVSMPSGAHPAAAVLYDDQERFVKTANPMLKKFGEAWQPNETRAAHSENAPIRASAPQPLHPTTFPDGSGSVSLPEGWQIVGGGGGSVQTKGTNGEIVNLGMMFQQIYDTRNPKAQGMLRYLSMGHNPYFVCPYGGDLTAAYQTIIQQARERQHLPAATVQIIRSTPAPPNPYEKAVAYVTAELDLHDGSGPRLTGLRLGAMPPGPAGAWVLTVSAISVPDRLAEQEWPTMQAIVSTYRQNGAVIQQQTNTVIDGIHAAAKAAEERMKTFHEANDRHNAQVEKTWDDQAKYSKSFQNYQFDRAVVQDNSSGGHATTGYQFADMLVKSDPNRFQYVQTQDFLKGIDY